MRGQVERALGLMNWSIVIVKRSSLLHKLPLKITRLGFEHFSYSDLCDVCATQQSALP